MNRYVTCFPGIFVGFFDLFHICLGLTPFLKDCENIWCAMVDTTIREKCSGKEIRKTGAPTSFNILFPR